MVGGFYDVDYDMMRVGASIAIAVVAATVAVPRRSRCALGQAIFGLGPRWASRNGMHSTACPRCRQDVEEHGNIAATSMTLIAPIALAVVFVVMGRSTWWKPASSHRRDRRRRGDQPPERRPGTPTTADGHLSLFTGGAGQRPGGRRRTGRPPARPPTPGAGLRARIRLRTWSAGGPGRWCRLAKAGAALNGGATGNGGNGPASGALRCSPARRACT